MRRFLLILLLLLPTAAFAQSSETYVNARLGFAVEIPPGFTLMQEADSGDGRTYAKGKARLLVWGNRLAGGLFEDEVATRRMAYLREGWDIGYDRQEAGWASLSGTLAGSILYHRIIALCDDAAASFVLEYPRSMKKEMSPLVGKLVKSLRPASGCTRAQDAAPAAQ